MVLDATPAAPEVPGNPTYMTQDLQWLTTRPVTDVVRYRAESYPEFRHGPTASVRSCARVTALPPGFNPRTLALARKCVRDPRWRAPTRRPGRSAMERLRTGGYTYTLEPGVYGQHTADEFWFDRKEGFCEHIASPSWC
jgi:hypothetical protein